MQFFQDQYISLLSTWIQIVIVGIFIYKTPILIHVNYCNTEENDKRLQF